MTKGEQIALRFTRRAEELRTITSNLRDPDTKDAMLRWADDYGRIAERASELGTFGMPRYSAPATQTGVMRAVTAAQNESGLRNVSSAGLPKPLQSYDTFPKTDIAKRNTTQLTIYWRTEIGSSKTRTIAFAMSV